MIKPVISGECWTVSSEKKSFKNREKGTEESYVVHIVELLCKVPQKGTATIRVHAKGDTLSIKEGAQYAVACSSFEIEKGVGLFTAQEADFTVIK